MLEQIVLRRLRALFSFLVPHMRSSLTRETHGGQADVMNARMVSQKAGVLVDLVCNINSRVCT